MITASLTVRTVRPKPEGKADVELYSESQSNRATLSFRGPEGHPATVIVMRRQGKVWLVLNGAEKTTVTMTDEQAGHLTEAVRAASRELR